MANTKIFLRFLSGELLSLKEGICVAALYNTVKQHTCAMNEQIIITCECEHICQLHSEVGTYKRNEASEHKFKDGEIFNVFIKPLVSIPYVNNYNVSQYYKKNDTNITHYPNQVIWVNRQGKSLFEITKWSSDKNSVVSDIFQTEETVRGLVSLSPIARDRIESLLA